MKNLLLFLFLTVLLVACGEEFINDPYESYILKNQLIGTWKTDGYLQEKLVLFENNTFVDTFYATFSDKPGVLQNHYSFKGTYQIENNFLKLDNIVLTDGKSVNNETTIAFAVSIFPQREIAINDNKLNLTFCYILNPTGEFSQEIDGKWESYSLVVAYEKNSTPQFKGGWRKDIYEFIPERDICKFQYNYLFDFNRFGEDDSSKISITNTHLFMLDDYVSFNYEFRKNKLFLNWVTAYYEKL